eukprot:scaffold653646_cov71-Prasinocladus_malaysianus.AAC.1
MSRRLSSEVHEYLQSMMNIIAQHNCSAQSHKQLALQHQLNTELKHFSMNFRAEVQAEVHQAKFSNSS